MLLAEKRYDEAKAVIEGAVRVFEEGGEQSCLADALTIQATVLVRLREYKRSLLLFKRAVEVAANAGAPEYAGHASLSMIEEHGKARLTELEAYAAYRRADEFLKGTQDAEDIARLRACARIVLRRIVGAQMSDTDFSLCEALHVYEARFIESALIKSGGRISQAAKMLGLSHQTLSNILKNRHSNLQSKRLPPTPRRRRIIRDSTTAQTGKLKSISILYVEDNRVVADAVKETLENEGFRIEVLANGRAALAALQGEKHYDVLIFDNEMPGIKGVELVRRTRRLQRHERTPVILFSADNVAREAYRAGANLFLRKPEDVLQLSENIKRLLLN